MCVRVYVCVYVYIYIPNITEYRIDEYVCPYVCKCLYIYTYWKVICSKKSTMHDPMSLTVPGDGRERESFSSIHERVKDRKSIYLLHYDSESWPWGAGAPELPEPA